MLVCALQGPKAEAGHATARSLAFNAQSAAAAARSGVPLDLMAVAARVDAGQGMVLCISVLSHLEHAPSNVAS